MKIILHKTNTDQVLGSFFKETFADIQKTYPHFDGNKWEKDSSVRSIVCFCPHCGCTIYGEWMFTTIYEGKYNQNKALEQLSVDGYTPDRFSSILTHINKKSGEKQIEAFKQSLHDGLADCPVCGEKLSNAPGYCLIYSTIDSGCPFDEIIDAIFCKTEMPNSLYSVDDIHYDWDEICDCAYKNGQEIVTNEDGNPDYEKLLPVVLAAIREKYEAVAINKEWIRFCESCDVHNVDLVTNNQTELIKQSTSRIKEYIQKLIKTEMNIYSVAQHLKYLYSVRLGVNRSAVLQKFESQMKIKEQIKAIQTQITEAADACRVAGVNVKQLQHSEPAPVQLTPPRKPEQPVMETTGLFNKNKVMATNAARQNQFQLDLLTYQEKYQQYLEEKSKYEQQSVEKHRRAVEAALQNEERLQKLLEDKQEELERTRESLNEIQTKSVINSTQLALKNMIESEIKNAEETLKKLYSCRNNLYALDVVFSKYRNPVSLSTFYEYLLAGRCTTLEGADGAYNLYESQIRQDMIIGKLSQVIDKLDEIKENQYLIYSEIKSVNKSLGRMNDTMNSALGALQNMDKKIQHISDNSDIIAHNTAVSAHYSKVNAELTNALGYMVALS